MEFPLTDFPNGHAITAFTREEQGHDDEETLYYSSDEASTSRRSVSNPATVLPGPSPVNFISTMKSEQPRVKHQRFQNEDESWNPSYSQKPNQPAIIVQAGKKSYGDYEVLVNLNMTVPEKSIYGLVGSSGCGKTTLLSCIVGLRQLTAGNIYIYGEIPGTPASGVPGKRVGYMPQEVALNGEFTVKEVCHYFGGIYGMEENEINDRIHYLSELLDLKQLHGQVKDMSGGQQRRVSFAVAMLHEPEILILDEPTVGVDPILRQNIWKHLREIVETCGTTVIITTHYIEEMRHADTVAIMRKGELMAESSPTKLLEDHNATTLEDVVLLYCAKIKSEKNNAKGKYGNVKGRMEQFATKQQTPIPVSTYDFDYGPARRHTNPKDIQTTSVNRMKALIRKNLMIMMRSLIYLAINCISPAAVVAIFCYAIGSDPQDLELGVINREIPDGYICNPNPGYETCLPDHLSCRFLDILDSDIIKLVPLKDEAHALERVEKRKILGYIEFPLGFSDRMIAKTLSRKPKIFKNLTVEDTNINVKLDLASLEMGLTLKKLIQETYTNFSKNLQVACNTTTHDVPLVYNEPYYGSDYDPLTNYVSLGLCLGFLFFMPSLTCGLAYIVEKKDGMLARTMVAGVTTLEILLSHLAVQFITFMLQGGLMFFILFVGFDVPREGNIFLAFLLAMLCGISGMSLGFLGATICDEEKSAMLIAIAAMLPNFLISGEIWPIEILPDVLFYASNLLPSTHATEALRSILLRGWGLSHFSVLLGFLSSIGWICLYWFAIIMVYRFRAKTS